MYRVAFSIVFALGLSACSVSRHDEADKMSLDELPQDNYRDSHASSDTRGSQTVLVSLPGDAGSVTRTSEKVYPEGFRQEIVYGRPVAGLGESGIDLRVQTSKQLALDDSLSAAKPTEAGIRSELASQFPRMTMQVVDRPRSNTYGPYGLAVGRWANGARCIYAWQWINDVKINNSNGGINPASIRIRLCRTDATLDQLAGYVDRLQIDLSKYDKATFASRTTEKLPAVVHRSRRKLTGREVAEQQDEAPVVRMSNNRHASRAPAVVATTVPQSSENIREPSLDPSLPAAAYRGPTIPNPVVSLAGK